MHYCDFVYCIDRNFNKQAFLSIASLIKTGSLNGSSVYIVHKNPRSFNKYKKKLLKIMPNLNIELIKFKYNIKNFPNLKNSHVSEATYYRMFLADHLDNVKNNVMYVDADAYFINNISHKIPKIIKILSERDLLIAAKTEFSLKKNQSPDIFERLGMNDKYFNAGVMIINLQKWKENNISNILNDKVFELENKIIFWDQDVLNSFINGKYYELPQSFNFLIDINYPENFKNQEVDIIHYAGNTKPWSKKGVLLNPNTYYTKLEKEFFNF